MKLLNHFSIIRTQFTTLLFYILNHLVNDIGLFLKEDCEKYNQFYLTDLKFQTLNLFLKKLLLILICLFVSFELSSKDFTEKT